MDLSEYVQTESIDESDHICETDDGEVILAISRNKGDHFFVHENGYTLTGDELELLEKSDLDGVHIHEDDTDNILRFDASAYINGERVSLGNEEKAIASVQEAL